LRGHEPPELPLRTPPQSLPCVWHAIVSWRLIVFRALRHDPKQIIRQWLLQRNRFFY
jgi:hypothetical protein